MKKIGENFVVIGSTLYIGCFQSRGGLDPRIGSIREHSGEEDAIAEGNEASARVEEVEEGARVEAHFTEDNSGTLRKGKKNSKILLRYTLLFLRFDI